MELKDVLAYSERLKGARMYELIALHALSQAKHLAEHVRLIVVGRGIEEGDIPTPNGRKVTITEIKDAENRYLDESEAYAHSLADVAHCEQSAALAAIERKYHEDNMSMVRALMYERSGGGQQDK
jgi:hypothetical protein